MIGQLIDRYALPDLGEEKGDMRHTSSAARCSAAAAVNADPARSVASAVADSAPFRSACASIAFAPSRAGGGAAATRLRANKVDSNAAGFQGSARPGCLLRRCWASTWAQKHTGVNTLCCCGFSCQRQPYQARCGRQCEGGAHPAAFPRPDSSSRSLACATSRSSMRDRTSSGSAPRATDAWTCFLRGKRGNY